MKTFTSVSKSYLLVFVLVINYFSYVDSLNMWTSLEQKQSPTKRCVSPCKIFHTWCKNEGKCREKGKDCTWYCECPSNCEGFFCEKKVDTDNSIDTKQTVEVKVTYEKEKKKPVSAFDKSKLAQALAGIFLKEKQTEEEKKTVLPDTIERVGNTIKTIKTKEVILNCPPGELNEKASTDESSKQTTKQSVTVIQNSNSSTFTQSVTESSSNISESTSRIMNSSYPTTDQMSSKSVERPIVSASYSELTTTTTASAATTTTTTTTKDVAAAIATATAKMVSATQTKPSPTEPELLLATKTANIHIVELNLNENENATSPKENNIIIETTTVKSFKNSSSLKLKQSSNVIVPRVPSRDNPDLSKPALKRKGETTSVISAEPSSDISSPPSLMTSNAKLSSQTQSDQPNITSASPNVTLFSTTKSAVEVSKLQSETKQTVTKSHAPAKEKLTVEIQTTITNRIYTSTSMPEKQFVKDSRIPIENSLYAQESNIVNVADRPNLLQIIEKAIAVEPVTTTEKTSSNGTTHSTIIHSTTVPKSANQSTGNSNLNDESTSRLSNITTTIKPTEQNGVMEKRNETELWNDNTNATKSTSFKKQPSINLSTTSEITNLSIIHEKNHTIKPFFKKSSSNDTDSNTDRPKIVPKLRENASVLNQGENNGLLNSTTPPVERPINDQTLKRFSETRVKTEFETTTTKTKNDATLTKKRKTSELSNSSNVNEGLLPVSKNNNETYKQHISKDFLSENYKSSDDILSTNRINLSSSTNVPLLNMSQAITLNHDLPNTTQIEMSTVQTVMSNQITTQQQLAETSVKNVQESVADAPSATEQSKNKILMESEGTLTTPATVTKAFTDFITSAEMKESSIKTLKSTLKSNSNTVKNETLLNVIANLTTDTNINDQPDTSSSRVNGILKSTTPKFTKAITLNDGNKDETTTMKATTTVYNTEIITTTFKNNFQNENSTKTYIRLPKDETTTPESNLNDSSQTEAESETNNTESSVFETTRKTFVTDIPTSSENNTRRTIQKKLSTYTSSESVSHTDSTKPYSEINKSTTESVIYSAEIGAAKLSLAKNILENKEDILKKSKVKNGLLNDKLSETVKDLKFDLLKMGLRDKGLPSDIDNII